MGTQLFVSAINFLAIFTLSLNSNRQMYPAVEAASPVRANSCYNEFRRPQMCLPEFHNLAYGKKIFASHSCGKPPRRFCKWETPREKTCDVCDSNNPSKTHPVEFLTDLNNQNNVTCWQADPKQSRENITLLLSLGKIYDITYISLQFCTIRPDSMAIYKSMDFGKSWRPYQFYSGSCSRVYGRPKKAFATKENEQEALCTDAHLIKPLQGGRIAFSTLEGRPSAKDFESNFVLQEWVSATDVKVVFNRISSTKTRDVRNYYAVSDFVVGGRCHCNGHASSCPANRDGKPVCDCKHHTTGFNCEQCKAFFNDRPWRPATGNSANECVACNCNLHAKACVFNIELFKLSGGGSGGVCVNCRHNTAGRYCHYCKQGFYKDPTKDITHIKVCKRK
ncbi:netrin-1-like [Montipora capricornis]|uniref:netrin-1-like n=1 Tax=Montipora capricornis TaxID=246305 RepID=UPI0035F17C07